MIKEIPVPVTTTGANGSATGTAYTPPIQGRVITVSFVPHVSLPNTSDVVFSEDGGAGRTILSLSDLTTSSVTKNPREPLTDTAGDALTFDATEPLVAPIALGGRRIKVEVTQSDALDPALTAYILVEE